VLETILSLIKENDITEKELLKQCGINTSFLTDWKNGRIKNPSFDKLVKIAQYFNVSLDYLTGRTGNPDIINNNYELNISEEESELLEDFRLLDKYEQNIILGKISEIIYNKNIEKNNMEVSEEFISIDIKDRLSK